jgi:hypothetical protein
MVKAAGKAGSEAFLQHMNQQSSAVYELMAFSPSLRVVAMDYRPRCSMSSSSRPSALCAL